MNKNPLEMARQGGITSLPPGLAHRASERVTKLFDTSLLLLFYFPKTLCDCQFGFTSSEKADSPKSLESLESESKGRNRWSEGSLAKQVTSN